MTLESLLGASSSLLGLLFLQPLEHCLGMCNLPLAHLLDDCHAAVVHDKRGENGACQA
ncbi:hypothetical protein D9M69_717930 [compost metagenome]